MLKSGFTTGSCAAIAAKAAMKMLLCQRQIEKEFIITPSQKKIEVMLHSIKFNKEFAECSVIKYSGDDPDITNGIQVFARVRLLPCEIIIDGGKGVGRITKPGLDRAVGEAAINSVPRKMIEDAVRSVIEENGAECGAEIIISMPEGEVLAKKTFNPRLGIEGGLSVLGTSGVVEPMSEKALIDTIRVELGYKRKNGCEYVLVVPGNYGRDFALEKWNTDIDAAVKCSNYIGEAIDFAIEKGFKGFTLIGHAGKLIKLAAGIMNTHSKQADGRAEVLCTHAALCGAEHECIERLFQSITTDEAVGILIEYKILKPVVESIGKRIEYYLNKRCDGKIEFAFVMFSNVYGVLSKGGSKNVFNRSIKEAVG